MAEEGGSPREIVEVGGLEQVRDVELLDAWVEATLEDCAEEVERYQNGEGRLLGFLVGQVMRRSEGRADPLQARERLLSRLD